MIRLIDVRQQLLFRRSRKLVVRVISRRTRDDSRRVTRARGVDGIWCEPSRLVVGRRVGRVAGMGRRRRGMK